MLRKALRVAGKELTGFFASPAAVLFLAAFLGVTLFVFFWVAAFFERNLADVRPLFQWMPVLLIFLVAALTMRAWAEERRSGTLELLLTSPTAPTELVLGKFLGCMGLVLIALVLTAAAADHRVAARSARLGPGDRRLCGGDPAGRRLRRDRAVGLLPHRQSDREPDRDGADHRGVLSDRLRCADGAGGLPCRPSGCMRSAPARASPRSRVVCWTCAISTITCRSRPRSCCSIASRSSSCAGRAIADAAQHRRWYWLTALLAANLLGANLWLGQIGGARLDLTAGRLYTLSDATRSDLAAAAGAAADSRLLQRQHTSAARAAGAAAARSAARNTRSRAARKVRVEFVDPHEDPKVESEATSRYDIRPVPFQVSGKYQASVVNSYFDVLVSYGDQYQVLNYRDLIDIKVRGDSDLNVELKNPEYALTSAIRKVLLSYQGGGNVFDTLPQPLTFTGYISSTQSLPPELQQVRTALDGALSRSITSRAASSRCRSRTRTANSALATRLTHDFGFRPMVLSLTDPKPFWFYMTLERRPPDRGARISRQADQAGFKAAIEAGVKRFSPGFLKTLAVMSPSSGGESQQFGPGQESYSMLRDALSSSVRWLDTDLKSGRVPSEADMLVLLDPVGLEAKQVFAVDQFLMQGGTVLIATSPTQVAIDQSIMARPVTSGLGDWLAAYGLSFGKGLVLDRQSGALPIPVQRDVGGVSVNELELANYPYIIDVRGSGLDPNSPVTGEPRPNRCALGGADRDRCPTQHGTQTHATAALLE